MSEDEMLRLACIYAESDRTAYLTSWENCNDAAAKRIKRKTLAFLKKISVYRLKRWGKTKLESTCEAATEVRIP